MIDKFGRKLFLATMALLLVSISTLCACNGSGSANITDSNKTTDVSNIGLNGAGATFPAPLYMKWFDEYSKLTGIDINYQAVGSGAGITAITSGNVFPVASVTPVGKGFVIVLMAVPFNAALAA